MFIKQTWPNNIINFGTKLKIFYVNSLPRKDVRSLQVVKKVLKICKILTSSSGGGETYYFYMQKKGQKKYVEEIQNSREISKTFIQFVLFSAK